MLSPIKILALSGLYAISWSAQTTSTMPSKPDLQKVYNEALAWSKTKFEQMPPLQQQQITSGIGVCKGKDTDETESSETNSKFPGDLPLAPGCMRKKQRESSQPLNLQREGGVSEAVDPTMLNTKLKNKQEKIPQDKILVFVSFSMPKASLEALSHLAEQYNAVLVMRGLRDDSFKATQKAFQELGNETQSGIEINPEAFETYHIKQVPVFVLVKAGAQDNPEELARLSGNVSLSFAAQKLRENA